MPVAENETNANYMNTKKHLEKYVPRNMVSEEETSKVEIVAIFAFQLHTTLNNLH